MALKVTEGFESNAFMREYKNRQTLLGFHKKEESSTSGSRQKWVCGGILQYALKEPNVDVSRSNVQVQFSVFTFRPHLHTLAKAQQAAMSPTASASLPVYTASVRHC